MVIFKEKNMQPIDYARQTIKMIDDLKSIYEEDLYLIINSLGMSMEKIERLDISKQDFIQLNGLHSEQFHQNRQINQPWLDRFIGECKEV